MSTPLAPLAMSQTKDDLLKHLNMDGDTYNLMAKEADHIYRWLTSEKRHLKKNCKRKPPYDWSDIVEKSKDEAMRAIAQSGSDRTSYYWNLATPTNDCPNWIARWFLYHKFRYRDGRNRNIGRADEGGFTSRSSTTASSSSNHHHHHHHHTHHRQSQTIAIEDTRSYGNQTNYYSNASMTTGAVPGYDYRSTVPMPSHASYATYESNQLYEASPSSYPAYTSSSQDNGHAKAYYDPVRDI